MCKKINVIEVRKWTASVYVKNNVELGTITTTDTISSWCGEIEFQRGEDILKGKLEGNVLLFDDGRRIPMCNVIEITKIEQLPTVYHFEYIMCEHWWWGLQFYDMSGNKTSLYRLLTEFYDSIKGAIMEETC